MLGLPVPSLARLSALPAALAGVDLGVTVAELDAVFRKHGATTQPTPFDLVLQRGGPLGNAAIASIALESDRIARAVITHVRAAPFFAGLALAVHPRPDVEAPMLVADVVVPPPGTLRLFVDACGPAIGRPSFAGLFREPLAPIVDGARGLSQESVPPWIAPLSGGCGGRLRARPRRGAQALRVLATYVDRYLDGLAAAPPAADAAGNAATMRTVRDVVRANGPAGRHLERLFGSPFATRYLRLLWNDESAPI